MLCKCVDNWIKMNSSAKKSGININAANDQKQLDLSLNAARARKSNILELTLKDFQMVKKFFATVWAIS